MAGICGLMQFVFEEIPSVCRAMMKRIKTSCSSFKLILSRNRFGGGIEVKQGWTVVDERRNVRFQIEFMVKTE